MAKLRKHSHYFKDVSHLTQIDVYRVCERFQIQDPSGAIQHAIKKILLPGQRGGKDREKDIREAIDSLERYLDMVNEDRFKNGVNGSYKLNQDSKNTNPTGG